MWNKKIVNKRKDELLQEIERLLREENRYMNYSKTKLFINKIMGISDYTPGKYISEAEGLMEGLYFAWVDVLLQALVNENGDKKKKKIPPIMGVSSDIRKFLRMSNDYSYIENKEIEVLEKKIKFKLLENSTLHIDFIEDERVLYLNNEEKKLYLKSCLDYITNIKEKEIFQYKNILETIGVCIGRIGKTRDLLVYTDIYVLEGIRFYAIILVIVNKYLEFKSKLINDELKSLELIEQTDDLKNNKLKVYDYRRELEENFMILNKQLDCYDIKEIGLKLILALFKQLYELIQKVKYLEQKYNCTLLDKYEFFKDIDIMALRKMYSYLVKK